jgi:hypothetical protein
MEARGRRKPQASWRGDAAARVPLGVGGVKPFTTCPILIPIPSYYEMTPINPSALSDVIFPNAISIPHDPDKISPTPLPHSCGCKKRSTWHSRNSTISSESAYSETEYNRSNKSKVVVLDDHRRTRLDPRGPAQKIKRNIKAQDPTPIVVGVWSESLRYLST